MSETPTARTRNSDTEDCVKPFADNTGHTSIAKDATRQQLHIIGGSSRMWPKSYPSQTPRSKSSMSMGAMALMSCDLRKGIKPLRMLLFQKSLKIFCFCIPFVSKRCSVTMVGTMVFCANLEFSASTEEIEPNHTLFNEIRVTFIPLKNIQLIAQDRYNPNLFNKSKIYITLSKAVLH